MSKILTILGFEYKGYINGRGYRVATIVILALIIIASFVPHLVGIFSNMDSGGSKSKGSAVIIVTGEAEASGYGAVLDPEALGKVLPDYKWKVGKPSDDPEKLLKSDSKGKDQLDAVVVYSGGDSYTVYGSGFDFGLYSITGTLDTYLTSVSRQMAIAALPEEAQAGAEQILATHVAGKIQSVSGGEAQNSYLLSYVLLYILFIVVMTYGQFVVNSVVGEKSTKTMELLITSAKPTHLMFGKVLGVGCAALTQLILIIAVAVICLMANLAAWTTDLPQVTEFIKNANLSPGLIVMFVLFFVLGYFLFAFVYAALASTASKVEDAASIVTLPMIILIAAFIISVVSMHNITAGYVTVLSYIPFFSPFIMFARISMGEAGYIEGVIAIAILIAAVYLIGRLAAKIYRAGVMIYGKPITLKTVASILIQK